MSPATTLNSVVLPAPFGPRIARRSPGTTSRSTSRTAWSPPKRRPTPRKRRIGSAFGWGAAVTCLLQGRGRDLAVLDHFDLALPRELLLLAGRLAPSGGRARLLEEPAERLTHVRHEANHGRGQALGALLDLQRVLILDRLAVRIELYRPVVADLVPGLVRPGMLAWSLFRSPPAFCRPRTSVQAAL